MEAKLKEKFVVFRQESLINLPSVSPAVVTSRSATTLMQKMNRSGQSLKNRKGTNLAVARGGPQLQSSQPDGVEEASATSASVIIPEEIAWTMVLGGRRGG